MRTVSLFFVEDMVGFKIFCHDRPNEACSAGPDLDHTCWIFCLDENLLARKQIM